MTTKLWWLIHKDLVTEFRARQVWPAMLLLAVVVTLLFTFQIDVPPPHRPQIVSTLYWLTVFFAGTLTFGRSFSSEHDDGCWGGLLLYPVAPELVFLAKLLGNVIALTILQCVLTPLLSTLSGVRLLQYPAPMLLTALLGNVGLCAVGTLLGALTSGTRQGESLLPILILPLVTPVMLAAAAATRLLAVGDLGSAWWRWIQLLIAFVIVFSTAGVFLFELATED